MVFFFSRWARQRLAGDGQAMGCRKQGAGSREQEAGSRKQGAGSKKQEARSKKQDEGMNACKWRERLGWKAVLFQECKSS
jgi:hypothetical protein